MFMQTERMPEVAEVPATDTVLSRPLLRARLLGKLRLRQRSQQELLDIPGLERPSDSTEQERKNTQRIENEVLILAIQQELKRLDDLKNILDTFPELQRRVLIFRLRDELDYEEIGGRIDKSTEATRMLYGRSLKKLIELMLEERGSSGPKEGVR